MTKNCAQHHTVSEGSTHNVAVSFDDDLASGETISSIAVVEVTTSDLTLASKVVSTGTLTILGESVATGRAVQFSVAGGTAGVLYSIKVTATTGASPAQVIPYLVNVEYE